MSSCFFSKFTYHTGTIRTYLGADVNERAVGNDVVDYAFVLLAHHDVLQGDRAGREVLVVLLTKHTKQAIKCKKKLVYNDR